MGGVDPQLLGDRWGEVQPPSPRLPVQPLLSVTRVCIRFHSSRAEGCGHRCKFQWNDQVGLWDAMLPYYAEKSGTGKKVTCTGDF